MMGSGLLPASHATRVEAQLQAPASTGHALAVCSECAHGEALDDGLDLLVLRHTRHTSQRMAPAVGQRCQRRPVPSAM